MITDQHIAEGLSQAYVEAVAAKAGVNLSIGRRHDYGIDGTFHQVQIVEGRRCDAGFDLDFQLKASKNCILEKTSVVYNLEAKTFNDLVRRSANRNSTPAILVLLCLPQSSEEWMRLNEDELLLRRCSYWKRLNGEPTENTSTVRVRIPRSQMLTPDAVSNLLQQVENGELQ